MILFKINFTSKIPNVQDWFFAEASLWSRPF